MGCKHSSSKGNHDGAKKKRRNSGLILIEPKEIIKRHPSKSHKGNTSHHGNENSHKEDVSKKGGYLSEDSKSFIKRALLRSGVFTDEVDKRNISTADIENIVQAFETRSFEDGEYLFYQDDFPCNHLFIAKQGIFRGLDGHHCKAVMRPKDIIGELGFFHQNPRMLSIVAAGINPSAFSLSKRDFRAIIEKGRDMKNIKILEALSEAQKYLLKDRVTITNYIRGDVILKKGAVTPHFFLILSGQVGITMDSAHSHAHSHAATSKIKEVSTSTKSSASRTSNDSKEISFKYPGDYFGEERFVKGIVTSSTTFVAVNEVTVCVITKKVFDDEEIFGPVKSWIINDIIVREEENNVTTMRRQRSFVKFSEFHEHESCKSEVTLSHKSIKSLSGATPPGILIKRSVSTVDTDNDIDNQSNESDSPQADFNELDDSSTLTPPQDFSLNWLFSLNCGIL